MAKSSEDSGALAGAVPAVSFSKENELDVVHACPNVYGGNGTISVRRFSFDQAPAPANFVVYDIPPGASEGVHTHRSGEEFPGPYDEYYYIMQGHGEMQIDGKVIRVRAGDHLHTPLGVAHGISNTGDGQLRVFLTFIAR